MTAEQAAKAYAENKSSSPVFKEAHINDFIAGANWQASQLPDKKEQDIILSLIRCVLAGNPNNATSHQITRLYKYYADKNEEMLRRLHELLNPDPSLEDNNFKLVQSEASQLPRWVKVKDFPPKIGEHIYIRETDYRGPQIGHLTSTGEIWLHYDDAFVNPEEVEYLLEQ